MVEKSLTSRVETSLKNQFGVTISNASKRQVYEAMMRSVRDILMEKKFSRFFPTNIFIEIIFDNLIPFIR